MPVGSVVESVVMKKTTSSMIPARLSVLNAMASRPGVSEGSSMLKRGPSVPPKSTVPKVFPSTRLVGLVMTPTL